MSYMYAYTCLYITGSYSALSSGTLRARRCISSRNLARAIVLVHVRIAIERSRDRETRIRTREIVSFSFYPSFSPFARDGETHVLAEILARSARDRCIRAGGNRLRHTIDAEGNKKEKKSKQPQRNVFHISR